MSTPATPAGLRNRKGGQDKTPAKNVGPNGSNAASGSNDSAGPGLAGPAFLPAPARAFVGNLRAKYPRATAPTVLVPVVLTLLALFTRLANLGRAPFVVFDEAYFSKYQNYYLINTFYEDLHPPLGKMLLALPGWLLGYKGIYTKGRGKGFDWDGWYPDEFGFIPRRAFCATLGSALVPLAYGTMRELGCSVRGSAMAALAVLADPALNLITRHILLDPLLLFFSALSIYFLARFRRIQRQGAFRRSWWLALAQLGFALGCVSGIKWVGLLTVSVVGMYTVVDLWMLMADRAVSNTAYVLHWIARIALLILLPMSLYLSFYYVHFSLLTKTGVADAQMPPLFQAAQLEGTKLRNQPRSVAYGSEITLRSLAPWGGLLHSHYANYPGTETWGHGSSQQQVTGFHHFDSNNGFSFEKKHGVKPTPGQVDYVKDGDVLRLVHRGTRANVHSHRIPAPLTLSAYEVSGYSGGEDPNDHWKVELLDDVDPTVPLGGNGTVRAITARFRLKHVRTGCYLGYHTVTLPNWGFKQYEIPCFRGEPAKIGSYAEWSVESLKDARLPHQPLPPLPSPFKFPYFLRIFWATQVGMQAINNALIPEPGKQRGSMESDPLEWPLAHASMRLTGWDRQGPRLLLVGNVAVWWGGLAAVVGLAVAAGALTVAWRRGMLEGKMSDADFGQFTFGAVLVCVVGWAVSWRSKRDNWVGKTDFFVSRRCTFCLSSSFAV